MCSSMSGAESGSFWKKKEKDDSLVLAHKSGKFYMHVKAEDIDWDEYPKIKELFQKVKKESL